MPNSPGAGRKLQPGPGIATAATATTLRAAVLLRRMSLSRLERLRKYDRIQLLVFVVGQPPLAPRYV